MSIIFFFKYFISHFIHFITNFFLLVLSTLYYKILPPFCFVQLYLYTYIPINIAYSKATAMSLCTRVGVATKHQASLWAFNVYRWHCHFRSFFMWWKIENCKCIMTKIAQMQWNFWHTFKRCRENLPCI